MSHKFFLLCSTIGRKQMVGVTGLGLCLFLLVHMSGNLLIFAGPAAYNNYSHNLISNPLIYLAEAGLVGAFLLHLLLAIRLTLKNYGARDQKYAVASSGEKATSATTKTMWAQGIVILVFAVLHLITFKYGTHYDYNLDGKNVRDLHRLVVEVFHQPGYVGWYCVALLILGFHLSHGVSSAFQTLGINHPKYNCAIKCLGVGYTVFVVAGFLSQPLYVYFFFKG